MANTWFNEDVYLQNKLTAWRAEAGNADKDLDALKKAIADEGMTPESHFLQFGADEGLSPNEFFVIDEYVANQVVFLNDRDGVTTWTPDSFKDAVKKAGMTLWSHYQQYGWAEANPSNSFDAEQYFADKLTALQEDPATKAEWADKTVPDVKDAFAKAGIDPVSHYFAYGKDEGVAVTPVDTQPNTLTEALAALKAAQEAKAAFLKEAELANDEAVAAEVTSAETALSTTATTPFAYDKTVLNAAGTVVTPTAQTPGVWVQATDSAGVKAAKLADVQAILADNLSNYTAVLTVEQAAVAKAGLTSAVNVYNSRVDALDVAEKAQATTEAAETGAAAAAGKKLALSGSVKVERDSSNKVTSITDGASPSPKTYAKLNADGALVLEADVPAAAKAELQAVIDAALANTAAMNIVASAESDKDKAFLAIGYIDYDSATPATQALKEAVYKEAVDTTGLTPEAITAAATAYTYKQAQDQLKVFANKTLALDPTATVDADGIITALSAGASADASTAFADYDALLEAIVDFNAVFKTSGEYDTDNLPKVSSLIDAQDAVKGADKAIADLQKLVDGLNEAKELAATLAEHNEAIEAAEQFFVDAGYAVPTTVDAVALGTDEADIFLVNDDATIIGFGENGADAIFFGEKFSLVTLSATDKLVTGDFGDLAAFEVFAQQSGADTILYIEQKSFAGNASTDADLITVKLTGVQADSLVIENGALVIA